MTTSNLVKHARREMELIGEDGFIKKGVLKIVQDFANMGHSGSSAEYTIIMLERLLRFQNLSDLTDDPMEWVLVGKEHDGVKVWQNSRRGEAFSNDEGKTYYLLSEGGNSHHREPLHRSTSAACRRFHLGEECKPGENHPGENVDVSQTEGEENA